MGINPNSSHPVSPDALWWKIWSTLRYNFAVILFDWLCCAALALAAVLLHLAPNYKQDSRIVPFFLGPTKQFTFPTEFLYPYQDPLVSSPLCSFLVGVLPCIAILLFQTKVRSLADFHAGTSGLVKAVLSATTVSELLKHFVGGFRPHYIEVCRPDPALLTSMNDFPNTTWWMGPSACTGNRCDILQALWGFPSGHAATSFASAVFLALYINGKLKPFSDLAPGVLDLATVLVPLLLASLISGSQYVTHQHYANQIFAGVLIGIISGTCGYRLRYAAIFDFRVNHIPLTTVSSPIEELQDYNRLGNCEKLSLRRWWSRFSEGWDSCTTADEYLESARRNRRCLPQ